MVYKFWGKGVRKVYNYTVISLLRVRDPAVKLKAYRYTVLSLAIGILEIPTPTLCLKVLLENGKPKLYRET